MAEAVAIQEANEKRSLSHLYEKSLSLDFPERSIDDKKETSQEDRFFMQKMTKSMQHRDGHSELQLSFRDKDA